MSIVENVSISFYTFTLLEQKHMDATEVKLEYMYFFKFSIK